MRLISPGLFLVLAVVASAAGIDPLTPKQIDTARELYVNKCAKCHRFYEPNHYTEAEWRSWMDKMKKKSKLKSGPGELLTRYLEAYRAGRLPGKPEAKP